MFGDVTSANVVGYQNVAVPPSGLYGTISPTFIKVGQDASTDLTLADFLPGEKLSAGTSLQFMSSLDGATQLLTFEDLEPYGWIEDYFYTFSGGEDTLSAEFVYLTADEAQIAQQDGWYQFDDANLVGAFPMNDWPVPYGSGAIVHSNDDDGSIQFNGEVNQAEYGFPVPPIGSFGTVANACPVAKTLGDFVPGDNFSAGTSLQIKNPTDGATLLLTFEDLEPYGWIEDYFYTFSGGEDTLSAEFVYLTADEAQIAQQDGWYQFDDANLVGAFPMNDWPVAVGETMIIHSNDDDAELILPKAL